MEERKQRGVLTGNMLEHSLGGGGLFFGDGAPQHGGVPSLSLSLLYSARPLAACGACAYFRYSAHAGAQGGCVILIAS